MSVKIEVIEMLSKNNFEEKSRRMEQRAEHFSIRKLTVGAASVLIGLSFLGFNAHTAKADAASSQIQATEENTSEENNSTPAANTRTNSNALNSQASETTSTQKTIQSDTETDKENNSDPVVTTTYTNPTISVPSDTSYSWTQQGEGKPQITTETRTVTRTVEVVNPLDNSTSTIANQSAEFTRKEYFYGASGRKEYSNWEPESKIFSAVTAPKFEGYTLRNDSSSLDQVTVTPDSTSLTIILHYDKASDGNIHMVTTPTGKVIVVPKGAQVNAIDGIGNVPALEPNTTYEWTNGAPDTNVIGSSNVQVTVNEPGVSPQVVTTTIIVTGTENPTPEGQDITTPNGEVPSAEKGISNAPDMPTGTTYEWKEIPEVKTPGKKPAVVVVTFPDGDSADVPITVTVEDPTPEGQDITTPNGEVPSAEKGISNVPDMPTGTTYEWEKTPEVKTPGKKPAVVVVTFPDGSKEEVPVTITVENPVPEGQDITTPNGEVPSAEKGISNVPDMPTGTTYEWKEIPDVKTPGNKPAVVVVTFPDGSKEEVPVTITVETPVPDNNGGESTPGEPLVTPDNPIAPLPEEPETPNNNNDTTGEPDTNDGTVAPHSTETPDTDNETVAPHSTKTPDADDETTQSQPTEVKNNNGETAPVHAAVVATNKHARVVNNDQKKENILPQTGAEANKAGLLGLAIASVGAILGLAGGKKKRKN